MEEIIPIVAVGGGVLIALTAIICGTVRSLYQIHRTTGLKQSMLEAGMSPEDIEKVINAEGRTESNTVCRSSRTKTSSSEFVPPQKPVERAY